MIRTLLLGVLLLCFSLPAMAESDEARARRLINGLGCKACHSFEKSGSTLAPALDRIGLRFSQQQLQEALSKHRGVDSKPFMPSYATTPEEEINILVQFLAAQQ